MGVLIEKNSKTLIKKP